MLYLDGAQAAINATDSYGATGTTALSAFIGGGYGGDYLNGSIDHVQIWNRSLSASEISMIYNSGIGMYNRTHSDATSKGDVWYAVVTPADKYEDGTPVASNNVTINTPPPKVTLAEPLHGNKTLTNRSINFRWLAVEDIDQGQTVTYNLSIKCYATAGGSCSPSDDREYNTTATSYNLTEANELRYLWDDTYYYNWTVTAYDGFEYGDISNQSNFSIRSEIIISLINDTVNFGSLSPDAVDNTTDFSPNPLLIENKGNAITTVNLSSATQLFSSYSQPNSYFKIRVNATSSYEGSFNNTGSQINWMNVPVVNQTLFNVLNYSTGRDRGDIHVRVQVPNDEPSGTKSSILTLTGWYAL